MVVNVLPTDPPPPTPDPGKGSTGQNTTFSEHGLVAYQNKGNHTIQQHGSECFTRRPPPPPLP